MHRCTVSEQSGDTISRQAGGHSEYAPVHCERTVRGHHLRPVRRTQQMCVHRALVHSEQTVSEGTLGFLVVLVPRV